MGKEKRRSSARVSTAADEELAPVRLPEHFREALVPLVRLLARQAAREWVDQTMSGALLEEKEPPKED